MVYFYSDPHFGHQNIIKYTNRPFKTVEEMDKKLIDNWNSIVNKDDKVFVLGDFCFGKKERVKQVVSKLNGMIVLIMGNHDRHRTASWWRDCGFFQVIEYPIIYKDSYILSHEPVSLNEHMPYVNIHGHKHHLNIEGDSHINVSVEQISYTPVPAHKIMQSN